MSQEFFKNKFEEDVFKYSVRSVFTGRLPWQPAGIKFTLCVSGQTSAFSPCRKNYALDRKMIPTFQNCHDFSISLQSLGEMELRVPAGGAKIGVFCMSRLVCLCVGGHSSNKYCVTVYESILTWFTALFQNGMFFQRHYIVLIFIARWRHNFREIAVKNCDKSKNRRKSLCAQLRIDSREIWRKFHCSSLGPRIYTVSRKKVTPYIHCHNYDKQWEILTEFWTNNAMSNCKQITKFK